MSETKVEKLDRSARYTAPGFSGCALVVVGFPKRFEPVTTLGTCDDKFCACREDEDELHEIETGETDEIDQDETCGRAIVVMVGDDRRHEVDIDELKRLGELDYCAECGQIGCGHDGRDRSGE